jgi:hypothetical protein
VSDSGPERVSVEIIIIIIKSGSARKYKRILFLCELYIERALDEF